MEIPNLFAGGSNYFFGDNTSFCYDCPKLHDEMLRDRSLVISRNAILQNQHLFQVDNNFFSCFNFVFLCSRMYLYISTPSPFLP